jgi:hypothetical protein
MAVKLGWRWGATIIFYANHRTNPAGTAKYIKRPLPGAYYYDEPHEAI